MVVAEQEGKRRLQWHACATRVSRGVERLDVHHRVNQGVAEG